MLINSKEQIFVEKIKSLLKLGFRSTRYKDLFDFYYLINKTKLNKSKLMNCFDILVFKDETMREITLKDIVNRLQMTFNSNAYRNNLSNPKDLVQRLNGTKILLRANHDFKMGTNTWKEIGFLEVYKKKIVIDNLILTHAPTLKRLFE